jgi:hypothetical protein
MSNTPIRHADALETAPGSTNAGQADAEAARAAKLAQIPRRQRPVFRRAWAGKSRKAAMRAFCLECMGYESAEVPRCTAPTCPLYPYRRGPA